MLKTDINHNSESGYVMIYVLIAMMVISILGIPFLRSLQIQAMQTAQDRRFGDIAIIEAALNKFVLTNGRYPAPARPLLTSNDALYGVPVDVTLFSPNCAGTLEIEGVKCVTGLRDTTNPIEDSFNPATGVITNSDWVNDRVLIGVVPITVLGLNSDQGLDQYGRQMTYAVTKFMTQTNKANFRDDIGVIGLVNETLVSNHQWLNPVNSLHYMIVSHGEDGAGAYMNGQRIACPLPANRPRENENCDDDATFLALRGEEIQTFTDAATGIDSHRTITGIETLIGEQMIKIPNSVDYYDDAVARMFNRSAFQTIWSQITNTDVYLTRDRGAGFVAFDANFPANNTPWAQAHVSGSMRAQELMTTRICSFDRGECFGINDVMTTDPRANGRCPPTRGMKKMDMGNRYNGSTHINGFFSAQCDGVTTVRGGTFATCANGARGLDGGGQLICL